MSELKIVTTPWSSNDPADEFYVYDPATGKPQVLVKGVNAEGVDRAIAYLHETYMNSWRNVTCHERGLLLLKCAEVLEAHIEEIATLESQEMGKPFAQSMGDTRDCINSFRLFGGMCVAGNLPSHVHNSGTVVNVSTLEPFGVIGAICPFNWPPIHAGAKIAPALAVGNTVAIKPPEQDPSAILKICELVNTVIPAGVVEVLPGLGAAGAAIAANRHVRMLSFTGSPKTGRIVGKIAAENLIPTAMELGGKNAMVIFEDADVEQATRDILDASFFNQGEACTAASRVLVHRSLYDKIVPRLIQAVPQFKVGHPLAADTHIGPIVSKRQQSIVLSYLKIAKEEGAVIAAQAPIPQEAEYAEGFWAPPTLITGVTKDMRVMKEEIFGPVACVIPFDTYEEAIEIANGTDYGLVAGIYSQNFQTCWKASRDIDAGTFFINNYNRYALLGSPFGGCKDSGYGRERYADTLREYGMVKTRKFATGIGDIPQWVAVETIFGAKP